MPQYADGVSDPQTLATAALAVAVVALVVALVAVVRLGRVRGQLRQVEGQRPVGTGDLAALRADIAQALRHVAVVRYDAFGDMGGRLSFSAAVIDDRGDGLVFSSIHARGESRTYAKGIVGGGSDATLTPEEQQALAAARTGPTQQDEHVTAVTRPTRHGYFGPEGTFTQMALHAWAPAQGQEHVALPSVEAALNALRAGEVDAAMVPIENSVEGGVSATLDALASGEPLVVVGEVLVPITFVLAAPAGMPLGRGPRRRHAQPRVGAGPRLDERPPPRRGLRPDAVDRRRRGRARGPPALDDSRRRRHTRRRCAPRSPRLNHGLEVLAEGIGDNAAAVTRFVSVARPGQLPERTGADKTTLVLFQRDDHAGGLLELLEQFAVRGINMSRLESRPTKSSMGDYCFSIDIEGHVLDERVGEALLGLKRVCAEVRFLGSYPAAHGTAVRVTPHTSDAAFGDARAWLHGLRGA